MWQEVSQNALQSAGTGHALGKGARGVPRVQGAPWYLEGGGTVGRSWPAPSAPGERTRRSGASQERESGGRNL